MFRVDPKTVTRWAKAGKLSAIRTLGGHRRYRESEVKELAGRRHSRSAQRPRLNPGSLLESDHFIPPLRTPRRARGVLHASGPMTTDAQAPGAPGEP